jgi:hypothetical protein
MSRPEIDIQSALRLEFLTSLRVDYISSVIYLDTKMRRWCEEDRKFVDYASRHLFDTCRGWHHKAQWNGGRGTGIAMEAREWWQRQ